MYLDQAKARLEQIHTIHPERVQLCTEEEVHTLEKRVGLLLPPAYKEFLLWMGHSAGIFLAGSDCFYYSLVNIQQAARKLLADNNFPEPLPDDAFVFFMHQGYNFGFFRVSEGTDPLVYWYHEVETQGHFTVKYTHYSDFLLNRIEGHNEIVAQFAAQYPDPESAPSWASAELIDAVRYYLAKSHPQAP